MPADVSDFLLKEYDAAKELTFEIDELRNKISTFYATLATLAVAALGLFVKSGDKPAHEQLGYTLPVVMLAVGAMGFLVIRALARLRAVQLEHFRIMNNIREHFLADAEELELQSVVELSSETLPTPNRRSGSYMWVAMVILVSAVFIASSTYTTFVVSKRGTEFFKWIVTIGIFVAVCRVQDVLYLDAAQPRPKSSSHRTVRDATSRPA